MARKQTTSNPVAKARVGILGRKLGMTQVFDQNGVVTPVTVLEAGPCPVVKIKTQESDGYDAIQIGFTAVNAKKVNKSAEGYFKKAKVAPLKHLRELRQTPESIAEYQAGQELKVDIFQAGDQVDAVGTSIGKGFQGVMKRHNMRGAKASHGVHEAYRHGGSLGCRFPQHVVKGKKMAGHLGDERVTLMNLKVVEVRPEQNLILVKGGIPGKKNTIVLLRKALKAA